MPGHSYFMQACPTCGRKLRVRTHYIGREVVCQHCTGHFVASDQDESFVESAESAILKKADWLLNLVEGEEQMRA